MSLDMLKFARNEGISGSLSPMWCSNVLKTQSLDVILGGGQNHSVISSESPPGSTH